MKRSITRIGLDRHTHQLVLRPTFWAGEILITRALIHGVSVRFKGLQEKVYHGRPSHCWLRNTNARGPTSVRKDLRQTRDEQPPAMGERPGVTGW
jgi:hypothetical protein